MPGSKVARPRLDQAFVVGRLDAASGAVPVVAAALSWRDRIGGWKVRWGVDRYSYTVDPGLYAIGSPDARSPVLASANYKLSFDALRRELAGLDAWLLVLDTRGINVWCAAGKGTFGTDELVRVIEAAELPSVVSHNVVIVPQLGGPGVNAPEVRRRTAFRVVYGPVRAADLPAFLDAGMRATPAMRAVTFTLRERAVLVPVEAVNVVALALLVAAGGALTGGIGPGWYSVVRALERAPMAFAGTFSAVLAGAVLAPLLLPWIPCRLFAIKGASIGLIAALAIDAAFLSAGAPLSLAAAGIVAVVGASFATMNFTGTSTFTSLHGVEKEMRLVVPWQIAGAVVASVLWIAGGWY